MPILIDTNVAIGLRDGQPSVLANITSADLSIAISLVTLIELEGGLSTDPSLAAMRRGRLDALLEEVQVVPLGRSVVSTYGRILDATGFSRRKILDRLIAATAIVHDVTLATSNPADFRDVPGLKLEEWPAG